MDSVQIDSYLPGVHILFHQIMFKHRKRCATQVHDIRWIRFIPKIKKESILGILGWSYFWKSCVFVYDTYVRYINMYYIIQAIGVSMCLCVSMCCVCVFSMNKILVT